MKVWIALAVVLGLAAQQAYAFEDIANYQEDTLEASPRFLNFSNTASGITLIGVLILLGVIGYLIYVGVDQGGTGYNRNDYQQYGQYDYTQQQYAQYR